MTNFVFLLLLLLSFSFEFSNAQHRKMKPGCKAWREFLETYNKTYADKSERNHRRHVFLGNYRKIIQHNNGYKRKKLKFTCAVNRFTDLTTAEFAEKFTGLHGIPRGRKLQKVEAKSNSFRFKLKAALSRLFLPLNFVNQSTFNSSSNIVDWKAIGAVSAVRQQGKCGSCWTFAAAGAVEGQLFKTTKNLVQLSPQNLLDCVKTNETEGCEGGIMSDAYSWIMKNGIMAEKDYLYEGSDLKGCRYRKAKRITSLRGFVEIPEGDEAELEKAVANVGPVSIGIEASFLSMQFYARGIYFEPECDPQNINHAVLVVGYGEENGTEYWLIKNSWGERWGEKGYIRLAKNRDNHCGVATLASYPII